MFDRLNLKLFSQETNWDSTYKPTVFIRIKGLYVVDDASVPRNQHGTWGITNSGENSFWKCLRGRLPATLQKCCSLLAAPNSKKFSSTPRKVWGSGSMQDDTCQVYGVSWSLVINTVLRKSIYILFLVIIFATFLSPQRSLLILILLSYDLNVDKLFLFESSKRKTVPFHKSHCGILPRHKPQESH